MEQGTENVRQCRALEFGVRQVRKDRQAAQGGLYDLLEQRSLYLRGAGKPHSKGGELRRGYGKEIHQFHDKRGPTRKDKVQQLQTR